MEKISYISPLQPGASYPMATRIIGENLTRDPNFDPEIISVYSKRKARYSIDGLFGRQMHYMSFYADVLKGLHDDDLTVESEVVMVSCTTIYDFYTIRKFLNEGRIVIAGGPIITVFGAPRVRDVLSSIGTELEKLILVLRYVDLDTDLYEILRNKKDVDIQTNNFKTFFECDKNYHERCYEGLSSIVFFGFDLFCRHGECKFCTYKYASKACFINNITPQEVASNIHKTMESHGSNLIQLVDTYFEYKKKNIDILKLITKYHVTTFSGILSLQSVNYINLVNKYVNRIKIGLESVSDYSLTHTNKGYDYDKIEVAFDNMIKYLSKDVTITVNLIIDMPAKNSEDVVTNYTRALEFKRKLKANGFDTKWSPYPLSLFVNQKLIDGKLYGIKEGPMETLTGMSYILHLFRENGLDGLSLVKDSFCDWRKIGVMDFYAPIVRYDENGKVLKTDTQIVDTDLMNELFLEE